MLVAEFLCHLLASGSQRGREKDSSCLGLYALFVWARAAAAVPVQTPYIAIVVFTVRRKIQMEGCFGKKGGKVSLLLNTTPSTFVTLGDQW
jgi:hypothetical protein